MLTAFGSLSHIHGEQNLVIVIRYYIKQKLPPWNHILMIYNSILLLTLQWAHIYMLYIHMHCMQQLAYKALKAWLGLI